MRSLLALLCLLVATFPAAAGQEPAAASVEFVVPSEGWTFAATPDGAVNAQFGALPGDSLKLPAGSIDFPKLVELAKPAAPAAQAGVQAAVRHVGQTSITLHPVDDHGFFRQWFLAQRSNWRDDQNQPPNERLRQLMARIDYYRQP